MSVTTSPASDMSSKSRQQSQSRRAVLKSFAGGAVGAAFLAAGWAVDAAAQLPAFEVGSAPDISNPVKIVVVFKEPEDRALFESYYRTTHVPLALRMPYCASLESALALSDALGQKASFYRIATLTFNSQEDMVACMASEAGQAAFADVANFATGGATATIVNDVQSFQLGTDIAGSETDAAPRRYEQRQPE